MSNLAGTTWVFNSNPNFTINFAVVEPIDFTPFFVCDNIQYIEFDVSENTQRISFEPASGNTVYAYRDGTWTDEKYRTITFTMDENALDYMQTKQAFLDWLSENAVQVDNSQRYITTGNELTSIADQIRLLQQDIVTEGSLTVEEDGQIVYVNAVYAWIHNDHDALLFEAGLLPTAGTTYTYTFRYYFISTSSFSEQFTRTYTAESSISTTVHFWFDIEEMPDGASALVIDQVAQDYKPKVLLVDRYAFPDGFISGLRRVETITRNTGDATATPETILSGKTAYVKGQKITGTGTTFFLEESGSYTKSNAIWMINGTNYTAGNAFGDPVQMPADRLVTKKAALTDYAFSAGNATISGHLQVQAVTTKTVGGVEYVDTIQLGHKENWKATANGRLSVTFSNLDWIKAAFGVPS